MFVKGLKYSLEQEGFIVDTIFNDKEILERVSTNKYSIILLGVELPNSKGFNICKSICICQPKTVPYFNRKLGQLK